MDTNKLKQIMLVTTEGVDSAGAEQTAMNFAQQSGATVILVDSIRTPFHLPRHASVSTEVMFEIAMKVKQEFLDSAAGRFRTAGIATETHILTASRTSEEIVRLALTKKVDMVIRYFKGEHSRVQGRFGNTARNLIRVCPCPLLLVDHKIPTDPVVVACLHPDHGYEENQSIISAAESISSDSEKLNALSCWKYDSPWIHRENADETEAEPGEIEAKNVTAGILASINLKHDLVKFGTRFHIKEGDPVQLIPEFCRNNSIDIAVMSSASLNHPLGRLLGNTIEQTIESLPCALLIVKPIGFHSPVEEEMKTESGQANA